MKTQKTMYRIEWMWNGNWRMEENNGLTFETMADAEKELRRLRTSGEIPSYTRIVEYSATFVKA